MLSEEQKARKRARRRELYREHHEEHRLHNLHGMRASIARMREHLGGKCVVCGATDNLEIDHIDPSQKSFNPTALRRPWDKTVAELAKCQLLCEACHKAKHAAKHGSAKRYEKGCRCDLCVEFMRSYQREWKRKYRAMNPEYAAKQRELMRKYHAKKRQVDNDLPLS